MSVTFCDAAAAKVFSLIEEEGNAPLYFRAFVTGGGCSGLKYGFQFDENRAEDDEVITKEVEGATVQLVVDPISLQLLSGAEIDYEVDLTGEKFIIRNPNAKTTCGCGSSFTTE